MIIICPNCKKQFEIDSNLIPEKGRLLKCGSCDHTWFFNKHDELPNNNEIITKPIENEIKKTLSTFPKEKKFFKNKNTSNLPDNKGSELVKYQPKLNLNFGKFLNYLIVLLISFVAVIIFLDTFKDPLSSFFPNIELILYNLFETLKDLILFTKDLT